MKFELMPILEINSSSSEVFSIKLFQFQQKSKTQETHVILSGQRKKIQRKKKDISDSLEKRGKNKQEKQKQFYAQL